jgi:hypothetical protein
MYSANTNNQISTIYLNSKNAKIYDNTFNFVLDTAISCPLSQNILMSVIEFHTPNDFPLFTNTNNTFNYSVNDPITNAPLIIGNLTIPSSIMNPIDFCNYVNFNYLSIRPAPYSSYIFSVNYNIQTFKLEFLSNTKFTIITTSANSILGFPRDTVFPIEASTTPAFSLILNPVSFIFSSSIFIKTQEFTLNNINSYGNITNTLSRIPVNVNPGNTIFFRPTELNKFVLPIRKIKHLNITLENDRNDIIMPSNFQMMLKIEYIYPQSDDVPYDKGTIDYYFKTNQVLPEEEENEEEAFGN